MKSADSSWPQETRDAQVAVLPEPGESALPAFPAATKAGDCWHFMARQPILEPDGNVFGYELLSRSGWENRFIGDSDAATLRMISDGALHGIESLTRGRRAFVNCTRQSLVEGLASLLPRHTVLEILETVSPDAEVIQSCKELKEFGYQIALDDFQLAPSMEPLLDIADFVKVDFRLSGPEERSRILRRLRSCQATPIAEKIETAEEYRIAQAEGFRLFQGYFFCHPLVFRVKRPANAGRNTFRLIAALSYKEVDFTRLAELVKTEVSICYRLLRLVNSVAFGLSQPVRSLQTALMLVGEKQFRNLVLNAIAVETLNGSPDELLIRVLQRARFLEQLSPYTGEDAQEQYLFGLLSLMGDMLGATLQEVIEALPLREEFKAAIYGTPNRVSMGLRLMESYESGDWITMQELSQELKISGIKLTHLYKESLHWAEQVALPAEKAVGIS
jgi:EAL and modified HD-GYP domain-containing signal transduction protein